MGTFLDQIIKCAPISRPFFILQIRRLFAKINLHKVDILPWKAYSICFIYSVFFTMPSTKCSASFCEIKISRLGHFCSSNYKTNMAEKMSKVIVPIMLDIDNTPIQSSEASQCQGISQKLSEPLSETLQISLFGQANRKYIKLTARSESVSYPH